MRFLFACCLLLLPAAALAGTYTDEFDDAQYDPPWTYVEGNVSEADGQLSISGMSGATHVGPVVEQLIPELTGADHVFMEATVTSNDGGSGFMFKKDIVTGERCGIYIWANGGVWATHNPGRETYLGQALIGPAANSPSLLGFELEGDQVTLFIYGVEVFSGTHPGCDFVGDGTVGPEIHVGRNAVWDDFNASWYEPDLDGDGFCPDDTFCEASLPGDCDDGDAAVNPDATEVCNGDVDDDCDGLADDLDPDVTGQGTYYDDADADTFGDPATAVVTCVQPAGTVTDGTDCDDGDDDRFPGNPEVVDDGVDQDCDGFDTVSCFVDADGDGVGDAATTSADGDCTDVGESAVDGDCDDSDPFVGPNAPEACNGADDDCDGSVPASEADDDGDGALVCAGDCDDDDATAAPGEAEVCDGVDNDCDGAVDEDFGPDGDGDGVLACAGDCDDGDPLVAPGLPEFCDGLDNDCDGSSDEDYVDGDGDGVLICEGDCDDADATVFPGATEACNGVDDDCDGTADEDFPDVIGQADVYEDADGDGWAPEGADPVGASCGPPGEGEAAVAGDCDDEDAAVNPDAEEVCSGVDDDCDGELLADEVDADADGVLLCDGDCDDDDPTAYPGATEVCDGGVDEDCDGEVDESFDADADGFIACGDLADCDDLDPDVFPGAEEACNGVDDDCDGELPPQEADADADGWAECDGDCDDADATSFPGGVEACDGADNDCDGIVDEDLDLDLDGHLPCGDAPDCDDLDANTYPGAEELCDGLDNDCDGAAGEDEVDADLDGVTGCEGDCDDADPSLHPGAIETCDTDIDADCDGVPGTDYEICIEEIPQCGCAASPDRRSAGGAALLVLLVLLLGVDRRRPIRFNPGP